MSSIVLCLSQKEIDEFMMKIDGTPNKAKVGANGILGVSMAICRAAALAQGIPLWKHIANLHGNKVCLHTSPLHSFGLLN